MDRRILIQVTAPAVVIGLALFGVCLVSAWIVNRLQTNMATILSQNVTSLEAAQELELTVRKLRFRCFRYLVDPNRVRDQPELETDLREADRAFRSALRQARQSAHTPEEGECLTQVEQGYASYRREFERLRRAAVGPWADHRALADENPIHLVVQPCERFLVVNKAQMHRTRQDSEQVSRVLQLALLLLGLGGPASGLIIGYGVARGLSRSIHQLSVRVHDMARCLGQDVGLLSLPAPAGEVDVVPDGDVRHLDTNLQRVIARVREVAGELQRHQREMIRAQQLAAVGQLAASVAHEVRNPLMAIKMLVEAALRARNPRPFTPENLRIVHAEVVRLERTIQGFLDFARPPALVRQAGDLRELLAEAVTLVATRARQQKVQVEVRSPEGPVDACVDKGQLRQVLVNLLLNALDAMPGGGRLEVGLSRASARSACLTVRDTGPGLSPKIAGRLFTPFASTKETGTGLGLCICRRVVEEHGGQITGADHPAGGALFRVELPLVGQAIHRDRISQEKA
jgi:signal transduction histidine kinase